MEYDAIVIGSGPNGLSAAITLQREGLSVLLIEARKEIGGGLRSAELTLPGFIHDVCAAVVPLALTSPFFSSIPFSDHGLEFIHPDFPAVHPFDGGSVATLHRSLNTTASSFNGDQKKYEDLIKPLLDQWPELSRQILAPLRFPSHPLHLVEFGLKAMRPATSIVKRFQTKELRGLWAGMAAHSMQSLSSSFSSASALVLMTAGHAVGWPLCRGGTGSLAGALRSYFITLGGNIQTDFYVRSLAQLPSARVILFDTSPVQLLEIAGHKLSSFYRWQLKNFRYGMGVFKMDWALHERASFKQPACNQTGTVHLGGSFEEIAASEELVSNGKHPDKPFVLFSQPSLYDRTRAPAGKHVAWAYCHVPNGSTNDMTESIEKQVERFCPGFRDRIAARHSMNTQQMQEYNPNYIGGDIIGGKMNLGQLFTRPALRFSPYRCSTKGLYICSSSTPPGGGVHGMCGFHAARRAMKDVFGKAI